MGLVDKSLYGIQPKKRQNTMMFFDILALGKKAPRQLYKDKNFFEVFELLFR